MADDKLKKGISVDINFVDGETPSANKLSSITSQLINALDKVERAVGDLWDENYPYSETRLTRLSPTYGSNLATGAAIGGQRSLDITSLARLIGPAGNLNPHSLSYGVVPVEDIIPANVHEFQTKYPPSDIAVVFAGTGTVFTTQVATVSDLDADGDWFMTAEGKVYCVEVTPGGTITYNTDPSTWADGTSYPGSGFNTLPDRNQLEAAGLGVVLSTLTGAGRYPITLPVATHAQWTNDGADTLLGDEDPNKNIQLQLPSVLIDNFISGDRLPDGFLYLKNYTTGETYDLGQYYYNTPTIVEVGNLDLSAEILRGDVFYIATVGTDITSSIDDLRRKLLEPSPRSWGGPFYDVANLVGMLSYPGASGAFGPSSNPSNFAPQYLHRDGWLTGVDESVNDSNVMRGDLVLGYAGQAAGSVLSPAAPLTTATVEVVFGDPDNTAASGRIVKDVNNRLIYTAPTSGTGHQFHGAIYPEDGVKGAEAVATQGGVKFGVIIKGAVASGLDLSGGTDGIDVSRYSGHTILGFNLMLNQGGDIWVPIVTSNSAGLNVGELRAYLNTLTDTIDVFAEATTGWHVANVGYRLTVQYQ
jgi:hypothetical protein